MKRFLLFFALMLGFVSVAFAQDGVTPEADYDAMIALLPVSPAALSSLWRVSRNFFQKCQASGRSL